MNIAVRVLQVLAVVTCGRMRHSNGLPNPLRPLGPVVLLKGRGSCQNNHTTTTPCSLPFLMEVFGGGDLAQASAFLVQGHSAECDDSLLSWLFDDEACVNEPEIQEARANPVGGPSCVGVPLLDSLVGVPPSTAETATQPAGVQPSFLSLPLADDPVDSQPPPPAAAPAAATAASATSPWQQVAPHQQLTVGTLVGVANKRQCISFACTDSSDPYSGAQQQQLPVLLLQQQQQQQPVPLHAQPPQVGCKRRMHQHMTVVAPRQLQLQGSGQSDTSPKALQQQQQLQLLAVLTDFVSTAGCQQQLSPFTISTGDSLSSNGPADLAAVLRSKARLCRQMRTPADVLVGPGSQQHQQREQHQQQQQGHQHAEESPGKASSAAACACSQPPLPAGADSEEEFVGVRETCPGSGRFKAHIWCDGMGSTGLLAHLGVYATREAAARRYNEAAEFKNHICPGLHTLNSLGDAPGGDSTHSHSCTLKSLTRGAKHALLCWADKRGAGGSIAQVQQGVKFTLIWKG